MADLRLPELNETRLIGRLTRDPELKYSAEGVAVCRFSIAVSRKRKGEEKTLFIDCTIFRKPAEWMGNLKKGAPLMVLGELEQQRWEDSKTGQSRNKYNLLVNNVQCLAWDDDALAGGGKAKPGKVAVSDSGEPEPETVGDELPF